MSRTLFDMKKIIVIGCPGSGKSTFSIKLHNITKIPICHLDMLYWKEDKTTLTRADFIKSLSEFMEKDSWIIDGNYLSTMEHRIKECDTVIFLDLEADICLEGIRKRRGKQRADMPWIETHEDEELTLFVKNFAKEKRPQVLELLEKYNDKNVIRFTSREQADKFLSLL